MTDINQRDTQELFNEAVKTVENGAEQTAMEGFLKKHSVKDSREVTKQLLQETERIKNIKTIRDIDSRVLDSVSKVQLSEYFGKVISTIAHGNKNIQRAVTKVSGGINMNPSLHGFIFEQIHAATFNARAAAKGSDIRAFVLFPKSGERYAKNSVDIVIKNIKNRHNTLQRYQAKACSESSITIKAIQSGNYNNQRLLVPEYQVESVRNVFPGKTVTDRLSYDGIESEPISYSTAKYWQEAVQKHGTVELNLGVIDPITYARAYAEMFKIPLIIDLAAQVAEGMAIELNSENFELTRFAKNVFSGVSEDAFIYAAAMAAIVKLSENNIQIAGSQVPYVVDIVRCVYNVGKTVFFMATDKVSIEEGMADIAEEVATSSLIIAGTAAGTAAGTVIGSAIPVLGTSVGAFVGAFVGSMIGLTIGKVIDDKTREPLIEVLKNLSQKLETYQLPHMLQQKRITVPVISKT